MQRLLECGRIVQEDVRQQVLAVVDHAETLYDMQFFTMRRAIIVNEGLCILSDRIDDQRISFVVPPGLFNALY